MTFKVRITEILEKTVEIEANNEHEALQIADCNYRSAQDDYILTSDDFTDTKLEVVKE